MGPRSREELLSYGVIDPLLAAEIEKHPLREPQPTDPYYGRTDFASLREHRAAVLREKFHQRYLPGPVPEVAEKDITVPARDGYAIPVRVYTPQDNIAPVGKKIGGAGGAGGRPLVVMHHEGGWSMGGLEDEEVNCRLFARELGAVCLNVDYRLAPEHPFPAGINDSWDVLQWAAQNAPSLGADPTAGFIVGGGSAGGNIAAVLTHLARDLPLSPPLTGQYLCVPAVACLFPPSKMPERYRAEYLSHPSVTPSRDPVVRAGEGEIETMLEVVLRADLDSPLMVPFLYGEREGGHRGVPKAYFQLAGIDPLRDEGLIYERVLREESGVETRLDLYKGLGHYFWTNWPGLEASRGFVEDTVKGVRWLLESGAE